MQPGYSTFIKISYHQNQGHSQGSNPLEIEICMGKKSDPSQKSKMYEKKIWTPFREISCYAPVQNNAKNSMNGFMDEFHTRKFNSRPCHCPEVHAIEKHFVSS